MEQATHTERSEADIRAAVDGNPLWYHTLELRPGLTTPGWFDLRSIVDRLPWPDVRGKRCLDVATYDGFYAFELERRGAAEVVATDISDHTEWDWPAEARAKGPELLAKMAGPEKGLGFRIAHEALGSSVRREEINVYDLSPERVGEFDVVVCGALMIHLRDPIRALEAIRSVCRGQFLSVEEIRLGLSLQHRRRPVAELSGRRGQWWVPTAVGHRQMIEVAGFEIEDSTRPFSIAFGPKHRMKRTGTKLKLSTRAVRLLLTRGTGMSFVATLARPRGL
jgi:tRNA (mo5U34)-methyltransferase